VKVLISGGAGYIGSTIASACLDEGVTPVLLDNLSTGVEQFTEGRIFYLGDISDAAVVDKVFADHPDISVTIHCAALIVVPESVSEPLRYYRENVSKTIEFVENIVRNGCSRLIFSSSAAVYGPTPRMVVDERTPIAPNSPYGRTKAMMEAVLRDCSAAYDLRVIALRYFNPIGADPRLRTGSQLRRPTHLLGKMIEAATEGSTFTLTGVDWPTRDGTGIRDYVHVWDLARAHVRAVGSFDTVFPPDAGGGRSEGERFEDEAREDFVTIDLGSGTGTTVQEMLDAFTAVTGIELPIHRGAPRQGDLPGGYARCEHAGRLLGWYPTLTLDDGIRDALRWIEVRDRVLGRAPGDISE
jgi:UDP-glucose 4-epimerase